MRDSLVSSTSSPDEDKLLQDLQRKQQMIIIKNNFTLLIILNILNFLLFLFSFSFYMWYNLKMDLTQESNNMKQERKVWLNMLYVFNESGEDGIHYFTFEAYTSSKFYICNDTEDKSFCDTKIKQMKIVGYVCFSILFCGVILQFIDLYRLFKLRASNGNRSGIKAFWLHPTIIIFYTAGFLTYFFVVLVNQLSEKDMIFDLGSFGASFWIGISSIPIYIVLTIYYRKTKNKLKSSELVDNLIHKIDHFEQTQKTKRTFNNNTNNNLSNNNNNNLNNSSSSQEVGRIKKPEYNY